MTGLALVTLMGIPASGKSTIACALGLPVVTLDALRTDGRSAPSVVNDAVRDVESMIASGSSVIVDGCNVQPQLRLRWLRIGRSAGARCELLVVECDRDLVLSRNRSRPERERVSDESMLRYLARWSEARARVSVEGWDRVRVVSGGVPLLGARSRDW